MSIFIAVWVVVASVVGRSAYTEIKDEYKKDYHVEIYCTPTNDPCMEVNYYNVTKRDVRRRTTKLINKLWEAGMIDPLTTIYAGIDEIPRETDLSGSK